MRPDDLPYYIIRRRSHIDSEVAQWERAGLITLRSSDRNRPSLPEVDDRCIFSSGVWIKYSNNISFAGLARALLFKTSFLWSDRFSVPVENDLIVDIVQSVTRFSDRLTVRIQGSHPWDQGSIPCQRVICTTQAPSMFLPLFDRHLSHFNFQLPNPKPNPKP